MKNSFKVGDAVVYKAPNGDSISATVESAHSDCVYVVWFPSYAQKHTACVLRANYGRLTPFGASKFLVVP